MGHITLTLLAAICFISAAYGAGCFSGPGHRFPITCPGVLDSTKSHCCEISGSFRCCDAEEFAHQEEYHDNYPESLGLRHKRDDEDIVADAAGLGVAAIIGIIFVSLFPFILCCCCCCACCPCYHCCHPGNSTNVTIVQPLGGAAPSSVQNNFCVSVPTLQPAMQQQFAPTQQPYAPMPQSAAAMPVHQPPPQYSQGGYDHPGAASFDKEF